MTGENDRSPATLDATLADTAARGPAGGSLEAGSKLGRYVILERLGAGGMGVVYAAYDPELDRKIAVKLLHSHIGQDSRASEGHQRLIREAQAMARLSHPNVIAVHDVGERDLPGGAGGVWVAMEFVRGGTIGDWVEEKKRPWSEVVDAYVRAGKGLAAAHAAGLIHRDFKPDNVMVGDDGRVRVMDFGLARQSGAKAAVDPEEQLATVEDAAAASGTSSLDEPLTMAGALVGTPAYMAPEQFLGGSTDARTDQFSFCLALWEALTGERPFAGDSVAAIAFAVCEGKHRSPPAGTDVPRALFKLLERGLSAEPDHRWPSLEHLLGELEALAHPKRRSWVPVVLTAALVGAVGVGVWTTQGADGACEDAGAAFDEIWTDERRTGAHEAALATALPHATETWTRTEHLLDAYAESWRLARTDACKQAQRATAFGDVADRQAACFQERAQEFDALVNVFEEADQDVLANSINAVGGLPSVDACLDHAYLVSRVEPPADESTRDAVHRTRARLAEARALRSAGRYQAAVELSKSVLSEAEAIGYGPLVADVWLELAYEHTDLDEGDAAIEAAERAYFEAGAQGQERVATLAAILLSRRFVERDPKIAAG